MSLKAQALSGVFWSSMQQFGTQIITFVVSLILARLLSPSEFGLIAMISIFIGIGSILVDSGLSQSLIRTDNPSQEEFSTVFFFNLIGSFIVYLLIFFCAPLIADFYNQPLLIQLIRCYCVVFIINAFSNIQYTRLSKKMDFKTEMKISIPSLIISSFVGVSMAFLGYGIWSLVVSAIVQSLVSTIQLWYWSKWQPSLIFDKNIFKKHFYFGYKLTLSGILETIFSNIYVLIIGKLFPPAQLGFYNRADSLKQFPVSNISSILNKITFPLFSKIQNDDLKLKNVYQKIMQMVIFFVAPILFFMAVLGEPLFRFLFTEKWLPAVPYFQILCFNGILYPIHSYNLNILKVKGRSDLFFKLELLKKILLLIIVAISFRFGIYGLLYSSVIFSILAFFINTHYTGKYLNYSAVSQIKDLLPIIFLALISALFVHLIYFYLKNAISNDFICLIIFGLIGSLFYFGISYLFKISSLQEILLIVKSE
jgi:teichuronic acid exporter